MGEPVKPSRTFPRGCSVSIWLFLPPLAFFILANSVLADEERCQLHAEILLVQDISESYEDDLANLSSQVPEIFEMLSEEFDGFQFGMTTFIDAYPCGYKNDHCAAIVQTLTSPDATDLVATERNICYLRAGGGSDLPENLIGAVVRSAISPQIGWSPKGARRPNGVPIVRILIATTDFVLQLPGGKGNCAVANGFLPNLQPFPTENDGWLSNNINAECEAVEYPSIPRMIDVLEGKQIYPIFLFGVPYETRHLQYVQFVKRFGYSNGTEERPEFWDPITGLTSVMTAVFDDRFGFTPAIHHVNHQMDGLADLLRPSLRQISRQHCEVISPTPTMTPATTVATTTPETTPTTITGATTTITMTATIKPPGLTSTEPAANDSHANTVTAAPSASTSTGSYDPLSDSTRSLVGIVVGFAAVGCVAFASVVAASLYFGFRGSSGVSLPSPQELTEESV